MSQIRKKFVQTYCKVFQACQEIRYDSDAICTAAAPTYQTFSGNRGERDGWEACGRHSPYQLLVHGLKNTGGVGKPVNGPRVGQIEGVDSSTREPGSKYLAHMFCKNFELDEFKGSADTPGYKKLPCPGEIDTLTGGPKFQ